jgi:uncharacterized protein (UPF0147 family)
VTFTQEQLEHATDPGVFRYLAKALGEAHVKQAVPLLRNILKDSRLPKAAQREANHALWRLSQEEEVEGMQYDKLADLLADLSPVDEKGRPSDWQIVEEAATWVLHQAQSSLVQGHLTEVLAALEKALYHPYEPARIPVVRALGESGNSQTFVYFMLRLIDQHEPHIVAKEVLRALTRLAERNQVNLEVGKYVSAWFSQIQQADPMLADEVSRTKRATQKSLEDRKEER